MEAGMGVRAYVCGGVCVCGGGIGVKMRGMEVEVGESRDVIIMDAKVLAKVGTREKKTKNTSHTRTLVAT